MKNIIFFLLLVPISCIQSSPLAPPIIFEEEFIFEEESKSAIDLFNESINDFDNEMNKMILSANKVKPTYQLEVVYVIPKGQSVRLRANEVINTIFSITQKHYYDQLGVTFELKKPLIRTIHTSLELEVNKNMEKIAYPLIKEKYKKEYLDKQNIIFFIIEGDNSRGLGGGNIAKSGFLWRTSYEKYFENNDELENTIVGWSHETGHALALGHTAEFTVPCLKSFGVKIDELPSLIMQVKENLGSVYNYNFINVEKLLLLDPNYYPKCRSNQNSGLFQDNRPHASRFLKIKLD